MTTQETERERISATLETAADAMRGGKKVKVLEFRVSPSDPYTTKVTWWPPRTGEQAPPDLQLGQRYSVLFDKVPTGEKSTKGTPTYYRNFVEATVAAADTSPPSQRRAAPGPQDGTTPREDPTRESIERQVALKVAGEIACARIAQGTEVSTYHVAQMTDFLAKVVRKEITVRPINEKAHAAASGAPLRVMEPGDDPEGSFPPPTPLQRPSNAPPTGSG